MALSSWNIEDKIKIGDIFFIRCRELGCGTEEVVYTQDYERSYNAFSYGGVVCLDKSYMFLAVKYVGNGIVEEMLTGELILMYDSVNDFKYEDVKNYSLVKPGVTLKDYEIGYETSSKIAFVSDLEKYKKLIIQYPLILFPSPEIIYSITEESKEYYIRHSDEERKKTIEKMKDIALEQNKKIIDKIDSILNEYGNADEYMLSMAYLENNLYNFKNKQKIK